MIQLRLSYAWTIWKAQGQTIETKVVEVIGDKDRRASDINVDGGFPRHHLSKKVEKQQLIQERKREE